MTKKTKSPKKREISGERMLALQLVELIEACVEGDNLKITDARAKARKYLDDHGYKGLESIPSRVAKLESAINAMIVNGNDKEGARLFAELGRARRGLAPKAAPVVNKGAEKALDAPKANGPLGREAADHEMHQNAPDGIQRIG